MPFGGGAEISEIAREKTHSGAPGSPCSEGSEEVYALGFFECAATLLQHLPTAAAPDEPDQRAASREGAPTHVSLTMTIQLYARFRA